MTTLLLHCGHARAAVHADDGALLAALAAQCRPWITAQPATRVPPGTWTVRIGDAPAGARVPSRTGATVRLRPDHRLLHLPVPAPRDDTEAAVRPVVRMLRALLRRQLAASGAMFLEAAVLALDGGGLALVGGARAGKTTTLVAALRHLHGTLIANDEISLHLARPAPRTDAEPGVHGQLIARGYPRAIEVRRDALTYLGAAADRLAAAADPGSPPQALSLTPHRLAAALEAPLADAVPLSALVLLARGTGRPRLQRLTGPAAAAVADHLTVADSYESWLQPHLPAQDPDPRGADRLLQAVPVWRLTQPLTDLQTSADLLAELAHHPEASR